MTLVGVFFYFYTMPFIQKLCEIYNHMCTFSHIYVEFTVAVAQKINCAENQSLYCIQVFEKGESMKDVYEKMHWASTPKFI